MGKRASRLKTSGAFHSPLMEEAAEGLAAYMEGVSFSDPRIPLICNVDAAPLTAASAREHLALQMTHPVRFVQCVRNLAEAGAGTFVEVGFGGVLMNLAASASTRSSDASASRTNPASTPASRPTARPGRE